MNKYIVKNGVILSCYPTLEFPNFLFIGIEWIIIEAISEKDAIFQANLYKTGKHPRQKEMAIAFEKVRFLEDKKKAKRIIMDELFPPPPDIESIVICIEALGFTTIKAKYNYSKKRYWVAEIIGFDTKWGFNRKFIEGKRDFTQANKRASRGVYFYYTLRPYKVYEISSPKSNSYTDRYFCRIEDNQEVRMSEPEVKEWLNEGWV